MENESENRSRWLKIRLRPSEEEAVNKRCKRSAFQNLSEFGRAMILGEPVTVIYRDRSMDEVLEELVLLRRELNSIGNNLNQAVKNINALHGAPDSWLWMNLLTLIKGTLEPAITQIKERMNNYAEIWSQKLRAGKA